MRGGLTLVEQQDEAHRFSGPSQGVAKWIPAFLAFVVLICAPCCSRRADPLRAFEHATQTFRHGDMPAAQREAESGYSRFRKVGPEWAWKFVLLKARILYWQGLSERVLQLLDSEPGQPPSNELAVQKKRLEGVSYFSLGKFAEAERKLTEAEDSCATAPSPPCGDLPTARGVFEMARGHYAQAQVLFEKALVSARRIGDPFVEATALLNLSYSADEQAHFDQAIDFGEAARKISVAHGYADLAQNVQGNMGWAHYKLGDTEQAEAMFSEARKQAAALGDLTDQLRWTTTSAYIRMDASDFKTAEQAFKDALGIATKIKSRGDITNSLIALAFVHEQTGNLTEAKKNADEALRMSIEDNNKRDQVYPRLVQGRIGAQENDPSAAESAFRDVAASPDAPVFLKWEAEHSLARLYEDQGQFDAADKEYRIALSTFEGARKDLKKMDSRLPFLNNATAIYDDYIHFLITRGKTDEALRVADYSRARTLSEGLGLLLQEGSFKPYLLNAPQVARHAGGTVLFYWLGQKQSYLWAITPQRTSLFTLPPESQIKDAVQRYRNMLTGTEDTIEASGDQGVALYEMLVAPAREVLPQHPHVSQNARDMGHPMLERVPQVFIVPDGVLNSLNFETLLAPDSKPHYWIEDVSVTNANSLRLLGASRTRKIPTASDLLLLGDAVSPSVDYPALPKAPEEMQTVQKHFSQGRQSVLAQKKATPPAYLDSKPEQFSYIHFVAHGTASRLSPLESAIVLSKANDQDDSFKLYARDIIRHKLRAELVTVSACYGAGTRAYSGEGLVGLSWAFLGAGAHNVIGALWEVSDVSTPHLMDEMYDELRKGKSPAEALRTAKLSLLHSGNASSKPFYWAPFQLYTGS